MEDLYLETTGGMTPIDEEAVQKYHLEAGTRSPFTQSRIVEKSGRYPARPAAADGDSEADMRRDFNDMPHQDIRGDGVDEMDNGFAMSQSEIIDFSQGVDSRMDENR